VNNIQGYGHTCKDCGTLTPLENEKGEEIYFRLNLAEEFRCKKCAGKYKLQETDTVQREGKTFTTVKVSDY
jgi:tRNA(Ile2) C34 agmatinyltransferase TiaS